MEVRKYIIDYDKKHDIFYIAEKRKNIAHSIDLEDFVVDLDKNNNPIGLEVFEISKMLRIPKKQFYNLKNAELTYRKGKGVFAIYLLLQFKDIETCQKENHTRHNNKY